jgi:tetratricopeptide (TPR) repeat protein
LRVRSGPLLRVTAALAAALVASPPSTARACGPDFPPQLLVWRATWMASIPRRDFAGEASALAPPPPGRFPVVEDGEPPGARDGGGARERDLYRSGAQAFTNGDEAGATTSFHAVLALPAAERQHLSTAAAFMLGRIGPDAARWFARTRELAAAGFDDPLGLAVSSLGEEARRRLEPERYARAGEAPPPPRDDVAAVELYAQQAALGSSSGAVSLLLVARALVQEPERLRAALHAPIVQRLLVLYVWSRDDRDLDFDPAERPALLRTLETLAGLPRVAGADRLAVALWRAGRFDLAARLAQRADGPLATWVKAKAALRRGDRDEAYRLLLRAAAAVPELEVWGDADWTYRLRPRGRLEGECATLALARDDRAAAFRHVLASGYALDVLYVAERVLTTDELRAALDGEVKLGRPPPPGGLEPPGWRFETVRIGDLRDVLARRLMRGGRWREALPYYSRPEVAGLARRYGEALTAAAEGPAAARAAALFRASRLARLHGMELMGTVTAPDWSAVEGNYEISGVTKGELGGFEPYSEDRKWPVVDRRRSAQGSALVGQDELRRVAASAPRPGVRFHYREIAADHAEAAAALVPPRSQAHAALLCHAARYVRYRDDARYRRLWRAYVRAGRQFAFAADFGSNCPAPELGVPADDDPAPAEEPPATPP